MFGRRMTLFKLFGFAVRIDMSWTIIAVLVTWSLAVGLFPFHYIGLSTATYWWMGIAGALGLFASIIFHEMSHSLMARRHGLPIKGITLFIFGGVAEMDEEPPTPKAELMTAIAGPLSSIFLAIVFYGIYLLGGQRGWLDPINGVIGYLGFINGLLAVFNLIPAFPLDGGRVLRSILWGWKNNIRWGTRIASQMGSGFGVFLILLGVVSVFNGNFLGGIWQFLIGLFLRDAAHMSYQQLIVRQALEGESVRRFMQSNPVTVSPFINMERLVEDYIYKHQFKMFPVVEDGKLIGYIDMSRIKEVPRQEWDQRTVGELMRRCSPENTISPEADAVKALSKMNRTRTSRLMVVKGERLLGVLSLKDMLQFLSLKIELENSESEKRAA